jgi:hypothetical protein
MGKRTMMLLAMSAAAMFAGPASAIVCYTVLDKSDQVVYRGYEAPVDMSVTPAGAADREAMRRRGEYMMISYVEDCLLVGTSRWASTGAAGYATASVDEIVSGMRPFGSDVGGVSGAPTSMSGVAWGAPAQKAAPAAKSSSSSSSNRSSY